MAPCRRAMTPRSALQIPMVILVQAGLHGGTVVGQGAVTHRLAQACGPRCPDSLNLNHPCQQT